MPGAGRRSTLYLTFAILLGQSACRTTMREPPPRADIQVKAIVEGSYVSPVTNTPYGGSHVRQYPGRPSGKITMHGEVAVLELDPGVASEANLFDLVGRTLRFRPDGAGFRVENLPLAWVDARGEALTGSNVPFGFSFPFSGRNWDAATLDNSMGLLTFGGTYNNFGLGRYVHYELAGPAIANTVPAIVPFLKANMRGQRYVNRMADRVVITWDVSEPFGGQQDFTFERTPHHYQVVLYANGQIDFNYREMTARDAIVGVYAVPAGSTAPRAIDFSSVNASTPASPVLFEGFHHYGLPRAENMACTIIEEFGDRFDFMVWYADFRVDDQEAGTRSDGDISQNVQGIGPRMDIGRRAQDYCSKGRLQVTWHQPVWVGSVQAHERSPNGSWTNYDRAIAQIGHELGHRWTTRTQAIVNGDTIDIRGEHVPWAMSGAGHWPGSLHTPSPFPYGNGPYEASVMGGTYYQDNKDGTFTVLDAGSMSPASGFSYFELYLIGVLAPEQVPPFFLLRNQQPAGQDAQGRRMVRAEKIDITMADVIRHNGPRVPSFADAPKDFSTAFVAVVLPGQKPSPELLARTDAIRRQWIHFWQKVTGGVGTMSTKLR
jgi:hypothetical protein